MRRALLTLTLSLCLVASSLAGIQTILLGGGYELHGSQAQIELNLKWVQAILAPVSEQQAVFFTDGDKSYPDVYMQVPVAESADNLQPLARVFGEQLENSLVYRNHQVPDVTDSNDRDTFISHFSRVVERLEAGDEVLMIYNGHGAPSTSSEDQTSLKLWDDTRLSARKLHGLVGKLGSDIPFRYVFTQCYSGGFHRLIYENPAQGTRLAEGLRCGFTSESAWRQSEGCSASIDSEDYRDYTTFFFAALSGQDRNGNPLSINPDLDQNGAVNLREAHLYTLNHAHSTDLSRSSSEDYLQQWSPWYLRWLPLAGQLPNNEYAELSLAVARRNGIDTDALLTETRTAITALKQTLANLQAAQKTNETQAARLRQQLRRQVVRRWPQLNSPYTLAYKALLQDGLDAVQHWILAQADYARLRELQQTVVQQQQLQLETERDLAQMYKVLHLYRLAFLKFWLYRYAEPQAVTAYEQLLACESAELSPVQADSQSTRATLN